MEGARLPGNLALPMEISQSSHDVENQAPPLVPYNVFEADLALREALEREGGGWGIDRKSVV